ncbi:rhodanese-like domain-containing protein [Streptomyces sp. NPDC050982]|uniref:rhodanese-like domain-containing protein n=1 Tax=Streptomyces sp. NPDC050982 TaxID=3154746 RepID=UPI003400D61B
MTVSPTPVVVLGVGQARSRLYDLTVIDVRTPGEYASGHLPGALNIPLDQVRRALPELRHAAERGDVLMVCASGNRSQAACELLAGEGVAAATLAGGTTAWAAEDNDLDRPAASAARGAWTMERQVRFTAGTLVLVGLALGLFVHPAFQVLGAGVAGGLVLSALTNTCTMAVVLGRLPHNRPRAADLEATLAALRSR